MSIKPDTQTLLEAARTALVDRVAPSLKGAERYEALLIANAVAIAARELTSRNETEKALDMVSLLGRETARADLDVGALERELADAIRAGYFDDEDRAQRLVASLRQSTLRILEQTNPGVAAKYVAD